MKLDPKQLLAKLEKPLQMIRRYLAFIIIIAIIGVFGFLVYRIGALANAEPDSDEVDTALAGVKRPAINASAITKLKELQGENIDIKAFFPGDRDNPFQE